MDYTYIASITVAIIFVSISIFQLLLSFGFPLGEYAMGGYYKILPNKLRAFSAVNSLVLLFMAFIFLQHSSVLDRIDYLPTNVLVWIITIFLSLNTAANLVSRSKKERLIMTPVSGFTFLLCLFITLS
ncbi:hypothetical protein GJU40_03530 [Bacillus lacus]|uniref:DUF1304 domain-containing protein n=1 Tax=Metabacillus lacus TaxID=1983721 RepID=A0A7X2LXZ6_9BACI|nr:hypothetical protein [Metabacillus lacus]MRX71243.1 hypothetical protein [Metabacillus lacus]